MFNDGIKLLLMTLDASLHGNGCTPGYVFLFDMHGAGLRHLTRLSVSSIRRYFEYLQEGLPVRLKAMHVMNAVWFMDQVLTLIRPFMKRELLSIVSIYNYYYYFLLNKCNWQKLMINNNLNTTIRGYFIGVELLHTRQVSLTKKLKTWFFLVSSDTF